MIFQGLFNIIDIYLNHIDLFYISINQYFRNKINNYTKNNSYEKDLDKNLEKVLFFLKNEFIELGFELDEIENNFSNLLREIQKKKMRNVSSILDFYGRINPIVNEIFLKKIFDYLVEDPDARSTMMLLKSKELLPIEFIMDLRNLKNLFEKSPKKIQSLKKYLQIREKVIQKLKENKNNIEKIEDLKDPLDKLQLFYMVYKIIDFFGIHNFFDFSHIKEYIKNNEDEWLDTIPLVSLKNPDLYYCGIYLAYHLSIDIDEDNIKYFLLNIYDENIDEFEAPIIEATSRVYYFFNSSWLVDLELSEEQIKELLKGDNKFFETNYLKNLETSQLVMILKMYSTLGIIHMIDPQRIKTFVNEINQRITSEGINQFRDGFISSEATYHVLFSNYMRNNLKRLEDYENLLDRIVSRIFRNLEIVEFKIEANYDLVSELFYSLECLRLLNCIERKHVLIHLANHMFPEEVIKKIAKGDDIINTADNFRHIKVSRTTGEIVN